MDGFLEVLTLLGWIFVYGFIGIGALWLIGWTMLMVYLWSGWHKN